LKERLASLDVFRGLTIAGMLLVNNPGTWGAVYPPLEHAAWFGCTPADLIFPFFLFIVGITTRLSLSARRERGDGDAALALRILRRGGLILLVGLLLTGFPYGAFRLQLPGGIVFDSATARLDLAHWRLTGVLQRIALCYTLGALLTLRATVKQQGLVLAALLGGYWIALTRIPVPGRGPGWAMLGVPDGSLAAWLDRAVLGTGHLWSGSRSWDPEGLLSTFPAVGTVILGIIAARWIQSARPLTERLSALLAAGVLLMGAGLAWSPAFPIAKNLWTSSYVLFTGGAAAAGLAACLWLVDVKRWVWWTGPFTVFGVNPIAAYVGSSFLARLIYTLVKVPSSGGLVPLQTAIFDAVYAPWLEPRAASLLFALSYVALWWLILAAMSRRGVILKV
jgi:predicted acyltransferase